MTLSGNQAPSGGAIVGDGQMNIVNSTLSDNHAASNGGSGGGIFISGLSASVTLSHTNLTTNTSAYGGGIFNYGVLRLNDHSTVNAGGGYQGGGIYNTSYGTLIANGSSAIVGNTTTGGASGESIAAGVYNEGSAQITNTVIASNTAANGSGSGIYNAAAGVLSLVNVTLSGNHAAYDGGGIANNGAAVLNNVTIAGNSADWDNNGSGDGGGISTTGVLTMMNSLVGENSDLGLQAPDCSGTIASQGYNLVQSVSGCIIGGVLTGNITGQNPLIDVLQGPVGETLTHPLLQGSPVINAGNPALPGSSATSCAQTDQRGEKRPVGARCDIGAYERKVQVFAPMILR